MKEKRRFWSRLKSIALFGLLFIGIVFSGIAVLNTSLPKASSTPEELSLDDQHRIAEINHLRSTLGNRIWPGWGDLEIPVLLYNESHAFFTGSDSAITATGWTRIPYQTTFGSAWKPIDDDLSYFQQPLPGNGQTPQAFIVQVGEQLAASMTTKEWTQIKLVKLIKNDLPGFLKPIFPYQLFTNKFDSDWHIASVLHESFHVFQAQQNYTRFENAEKLNSLHDLYPWNNPDFRHQWVEERKLLAKALKEPNEDRAKSLVIDWLTIRETRRASLTEKLITYEKEREWLEGLAKYAEINAWRMALDTASYTPLAVMNNDPDFNFYQNAEDNFSKELLQLQSDLGFSESMLYYSGWVQAELLDRFYPDWKDLALQSDIYLEDLLRQQCIPLNCGITLN